MEMLYQRTRAMAASVGVWAMAVGSWLWFNGYQFGVMDHAIHLPYLLRAQSPDFLRGDPLVEAGSHHPSLLWEALVPLLRWIPIEPLFFSLHLGSALAMLLGTAMLARALYPGMQGQWASLLAPVVMLVPKVTLTWIPTFDNHLLNRTLVLGPELVALALAAAGRFPAAFLLAGALFLVHPTTASHTAALIWFAALVEGRHRRALLTGPLFFLLTASPLLAHMLLRGGHAGVPFPAPDDWMELNRLQLFFHHFPSTWTFWSHWVRLASLALILGGWRQGLPRPVLGFLLGSLVTCLAGWIGVEVLRHPSALHLHLLQVSRLMNYVAAVSGAAWVVSTWPWSPRRPPFAALALLCYAVELHIGVLLFALLEQLLPQRPGYVPTRPAPRWILVAAALALAVLTAPFGVGNAPVQTRFDTLSGSKAMAWARQHLPEDAVVATPPAFVHPVISFRYGARRQVVGNYKDGSEGSFSLAFLRQWRERMEALCGCAPFAQQAPSEYAYDAWVRSQRTILEGYRLADAARFRELARRFGATHALVERGPQDSPVVAPELPLLYEDEEFALYLISPEQ